MMPLLSSVATVAAIAISAPVWAQSTTPSATPPAAYSDPSPRGDTSSERAAPSHHQARVHHTRTHHTRTHHNTAAARSGTADQLNQQELATFQAGGSPMQGPTPGSPTGRGFGPKASGGNYVPSQR